MDSNLNGDDQDWRHKILERIDSMTTTQERLEALCHAACEPDDEVLARQCESALYYWQLTDASPFHQARQSKC